jgi:hypothetical protein
MTPYKILAVATLGLTVLSGCGSPSNGTTSSATTHHSSGGTSSPIQLAQCARANGVPNFPDPTQAPDGSWQFPSSADGLQLPSACDSLKRGMGGQGNSPKPVSGADMTKLQQFAQCMRQQGIPDWPDPQSDGSFILPARISQGGKAMSSGPTKACRQYLPSQGLSFRQ